MKMTIQADQHRGYPVHPSWDAPLSIYYDETNNIRRLTISELGLSAPADKTFAIAGIALRPGHQISGWDELRHEMGVQSNALEVKYKHVAHSDYEKTLGSRKLTLFLEWLVRSEILVHYSVLDVLYWSTLDIVESLMLDDRFGISANHLELKNELHFAISQDPNAFVTLLHGFGYPNLKRNEVGSFLSSVLSFVMQHVPKNRSAAMSLLKSVLSIAAKTRTVSLDFLHDNEPGELIGDFSVHFMYSLYVFKRASHVLDRETHIERVMDQFEIRDGDRLVDYRFADSKTEIGIQASDVVAGLIGRHFSYLQQRSLPELREALGRFSDRQHRNLELLRNLISRSDAFSDGLLHVLQPLDTSFKNNFFLHGLDAPAHLG